MKNSEEKKITFSFSVERLIAIGLTIVSIAITLASLFLLKSQWNLLQLGDLEENIIYNWEDLNILLGDLEENIIYNWEDLNILLNLSFTYACISFFFICLTSSIKGGLEKLKTYKEEGLIYYLVFSLIVGSIVGSIVGLISWSIVGSIAGLIAGLIVGSIFGSIFGSIVGSIFGLIAGLINEF